MSLTTVALIIPDHLDRLAVRPGDEGRQPDRHGRSGDRVRRASFLALIGVILALPACGGRSRPEGVVERWLLALNQGAAGTAGRYADPPTSRLILPGYAASDPGRLEIVEVGAAQRTECSWDVPFRVVRVDGREIRGFAIIDNCPTAYPKPSPRSSSETSPTTSSHRKEVPRSERIAR